MPKPNRDRLTVSLTFTAYEASCVAGLIASIFDEPTHGFDPREAAAVRRAESKIRKVLADGPA